MCDLRLECLKGGLNTACCPVNSRLINAKFVRYVQQSGTTLHVSTLCPPEVIDIPSPFLHTASDQNWRWVRPGNEASQGF